MKYTTQASVKMDDSGDQAILIEQDALTLERIQRDVNVPLYMDTDDDPPLHIGPTGEPFIFLIVVK